ncbi:MAG: ribosome-associated translation inhibitor RaiA [Candidatus Magasanikbacteria bacterium]|jgi:putative sigma-54 modulation protein
MQVNITGKNIDLTEAIKDYVEKKITSLEKFYDQILRAHIIIGKENQHHLKGDIFVCECKLNLAGTDLFISKNEPDLYKAIDKVRDHLEEELKKHKSTQREKDKKDKREVRAQKEYKIED